MSGQARALAVSALVALAACGQDPIAVADRGVGVPPEDLERIFDKFYRVHRPGEVSGTGLGLAICKGIVEAHRGRIWAQNRPGGGTIITMALPCEQSSSGKGSGNDVGKEE